MEPKTFSSIAMQGNHFQFGGLDIHAMVFLPNPVRVDYNVDRTKADKVETFGITTERGQQLFVTFGWTEP